MNSSDVKWLEKVFEQYKEDQRIYLDSKFDAICEKLDTRRAECQAWTARCRNCVDKTLSEIEKEVTDCKKSSTAKTIVGSVGAVVMTILLWTALGTDALHDLIILLGSLF